MAIRMKGWGQRLEFMQHVCDSSLGSCFQEGQDGYCDCHCKPFPSPPGIILCTISSPSMNTGSVVVYSVYGGTPGACLNEGPLCCCWLLRCTWGMRVFRDQAGNSFKDVGVCWQRWAELTGLAVSTSGCFGLHGLSRLLGKIVRMLPLGPARWAVRMYDGFRMSETCV